MKTWLLSFRLKTLSAAVIPVLVGFALVVAENHSPQYWIILTALLGALSIQIATNLFNDVIDFKKGADTEERVGPTRVTQSGLVSGHKVILVAVLFLFIAILSGVPLVYRGGWPIALLGLISLFLAYAYTGGPFPLAYLGLGDLFVILFFGLFAVGGVYYLHTLSWDWSMVVAGLQVGFLSTVLIAINNLRDIYQDKKVNKKTLPVRFGKGFARAEIGLLILCTFMLNFYWYYKGLVWASILPLLILPLAIRLYLGIVKTEPSIIMNRYLAQAALVQVLFGMMLTIGFLLK